MLRKESLPRDAGQGESERANEGAFDSDYNPFFR